MLWWSVTILWLAHHHVLISGVLRHAFLHHLEIRRHCHCLDSMRSMNHTSSNCCLLGIIRFFFATASVLTHVLEVEKAAECIGMSLGLHHLKRKFVVISISVNWTCSYHELLLLVGFEILFVLHFHHDLSLMIKHFLTWAVFIRWVRISILVFTCLLGSLDCFFLLVDELRLDFKILLTLDNEIWMWWLWKNAICVPRFSYIQCKWVDILLKLVCKANLMTRRLVVVAWCRQSTVRKGFSSVKLSQALAAHEIDLVRGRIMASEMIWIKVSWKSVLSIADWRNWSPFIIINMSCGIVVALFKIKLGWTISFTVLSRAAGSRWWMQTTIQFSCTCLCSFFQDWFILTFLIHSKWFLSSLVISMFKSSIHFVLFSKFKTLNIV